MRIVCLTLGIVFAFFASAPAWAQGAVQIVTTGQTDSRVPVAVPPFAAVPGLEDVAREMTDVIAYDLAFTGLVIVLPPNEYPAGFTGLPMDVAQLQFDPWRQTRAEFLVFGVVRAQGSEVVAELRMFDLLGKQQVVGQELRAQRTYPRLIAHRFSEEVVRFIDGTPGMATSEICFSMGQSRSKEIYVADYDGANVRQVTKHGSVSIMPTFSPDGNRIAYLSYKDRFAFLYIFDRRSGQSAPISREVGLNAAPAWSPDGGTLALTLSKDGNTEIYLKGTGGGEARRLTRNRFSDTSPTFHPSGNRIAFVSDRGGSPQIWAMNTDGSGETRLSTQGGNSYDPNYSPDGTMIAYVVERRGEGMEIYVMDADGSNARRLTNSAGTNESPAWSADSRHVMFSSSREAGYTLWAVNVNTGEERKVPRLSNGCQAPSWGPRRS